jgi:hypothetical protein
MAECMGLHRDGETYGLNPLDTYVRRLIWHQLCFLDIRTCEAQGPRPAIRRDDYDTKLPINCEEEMLIGATSPPESAEHWTTMLLPLIRFEINEMMRIIWMERRKLESRKGTLTNILTKIENFRKRMFEKYDGFLDDRVPIQRYTKLVMHLLLYRLHIMVLFPYHNNTSTPMPHRLNSVIITSGIMLVEIAIQLETDQLFRDWSWYVGAYHQYQVALLLAVELYYRPQNREAARIWAGLDYVFNLDPNLPVGAKSLQILGEIMYKTSVYQGMRKMRAPTSISRATPFKNAVEGKDTPLPPHLQSQGRPPPYQAQQMHHAQQHGQQHMPHQMHRQPPQHQQQHHHQQQHQQHYQQQHQQQEQQFNMSPGGIKSEGSVGMSSPMSGAPNMATSPMTPQPNIVFAGVSNGEALWSIAPQNQADSPGSSDAASVTSGAGRGMAPTPGMMPGLENLDMVSLIYVFTLIELLITITAVQRQA